MKSIKKTWFVTADEHFGYMFPEARPHLKFTEEQFIQKSSDMKHILCGYYKIK